MHFLFSLLNHLKKEYFIEGALELLSKKMFIYGISALISMSYIQGSVFHAIFSMFNLVVLIVLHA